MTTTLKIGTTTFKTLLLFLVMNLAVSCSNNPKTEATTATVATTEKAADTITILGTVKAMTRGKDGYSAEVQTSQDGSYAALVSIVNLGGPDKFESCEVNDKVTFKGIPSTTGATKDLRVTEIIKIETAQTLMSIDQKGFRGIEVGDAIAKHSSSDFVKKTTIKTGEGSFAAYAITDFENNPAGYFIADPKNKLLVGDITIETPKAATDKGIKVGDNFQTLLKVFPNVEVHGSESEGRTYATAGGFSYRLDVPNFTYVVDKAKIPATAKITQIVIERKAGGK